MLLFISVVHHSLVWIMCTVTSWFKAWLSDMLIIGSSHLVVKCKSRREFRHMIYEELKNTLPSFVYKLLTHRKASEKATAQSFVLLAKKTSNYSHVDVWRFKVWRFWFFTVFWFKKKQDLKAKLNQWKIFRLTKFKGIKSNKLIILTLGYLTQKQ